MTTEYYLQKKTIGGWSHVTSYQDEAQARRNYLNCVGNGMSGYSWRLVEVKELEVAMLNDVDWACNLKSSEVGADDPSYKSGWGNSKQVNADAKATGWGQRPDLQHGLSGSVWLVHYGLKDKKRVAANLVDDMLKDGWQRGGPRTQFE